MLVVVPSNPFFLLLTSWNAATNVVMDARVVTPSELSSTSPELVSLPEVSTVTPPLASLTPSLLAPRTILALSMNTLPLSVRRLANLDTPRLTLGTLSRVLELTPLEEFSPSSRRSRNTDPLLLDSLSTETSMLTREVSISTELVKLLEVTLLRSLDGELITTLLTGWLLTPGIPFGVNKVSSEFSEDTTNVESRVTLLLPELKNAN